MNATDKMQEVIVPGVTREDCAVLRDKITEHFTEKDALVFVRLFAALDPGINRDTMNAEELMIYKRDGYVALRDGSFAETFEYYSARQALPESIRMVLDESEQDIITKRILATIDTCMDEWRARLKG
jgi:hypothetical protein